MQQLPQCCSSVRTMTGDCREMVCSCSAYMLGFPPPVQDKQELQPGHAREDQTPSKKPIRQIQRKDLLCLLTKQTTHFPLPAEVLPTPLPSAWSLPATHLSAETAQKGDCVVDPLLTAWINF